MAFSANLPPKLELLINTKQPVMNRDAPFDDLRECSEDFQMAFMESWKAIKNGSFRKLQDSVELMQTLAGSTCPKVDNYLNVCYLQSVFLNHKKKSVPYYMTLLSYAAVNKRKEMVKFLLGKGARSHMRNGASGSPLTQMLVYATLFKCQINLNMVQMLIDAPLDIRVLHSDKVCSPIELAIDLKRLDIAKLLVQSGAHPIDPYISTGSKTTGISQILKEYYEFGTNHYLTWLLHEHLLSDDLPDFIDTVVNLDILDNVTMAMFAGVGRHPAHAILTCGHEDMIRKFIERHGSELIIVKNKEGRSALQISAERGDMESVKILVDMGQEFNHIDKADMTAALIAASKGRHRDIAKRILLMDLSVMPDSIDDLEDFTSAFEVLRDIDPNLILKFQVAHYAARHGLSALFKTTFPLLSLGHKVFTALVQYDSSDGNGKTPIEVAIEHDQLNILRTLQERIAERELQSSAQQATEKKAWDTLWSRMGTIWLLHACYYGSLDAVKFFIEEMGCSANYEEVVEGDTPLSRACEGGKDEIVGYLLSLENTKIKSNPRKSPILCAARNGFGACVKLLLKKGANVNDVCHDTKYNSLMLAIAGNHSQAALTILSDAKQGLNSLQFRCKKYLTPMRMLIEHMPALAEWVLNNVELDADEGMDHGAANTALLSRNITVMVPSVRQSVKGTQKMERKCSYYMEDKYELIEDFRNPKQAKKEVNIIRKLTHRDYDYEDEWRPKYYNVAQHPLKIMVEHNRESLLQHPLVKELINYKWRRIAIPGFLVYLGVYFLFLILLTGFAVCLPFPDHDKRAYANKVENKTFGIVDEDFTLPEETFLFASSIICILFSLIYLILEVTQLARRGLKYLKEVENYIQVALCVATLVFVIPVDHNDWILPSWRWQIGAIAVFLGWLNSIILLKTMPYFGVNITMLFSVGYNFVLLIYLAFLLILTFGFPFYMLLAFDAEALEGERTPSILNLYTRPYNSLWDVFVQTAGYIDAETFVLTYLKYRPLSAIMYVVFLFAMPILFNSFLIGIAVGETGDELEKANFTIIKEKLSSAFEIEKAVPVLRHYFYKRWQATRKSTDDQKRRELEAKNRSIRREIEEKSHYEHLKANVSRLSKQVVALKKDLAQNRAALSAVQESVTKEIYDIRKLSCKTK